MNGLQTPRADSQPHRFPRGSHARTPYASCFRRQALFSPDRRYAARLRRKAIRQNRSGSSCLMPPAAAAILRRLLAAKLTESLAQNVIVDNRPSASGIIGYEHVAKAAPDGYTLVLVDPSLGILPGINPRLPFDTLRDFSPVTLLITTTSVLIVHPTLPARSVKELVALARSKPGVITFASGGVGTPPH